MSDFFFSDPTAPLSLGGATAKYRRNLEAIRILKACESEGRPATPEEQNILAHYVGWGDSSVLNNLLAQPDDLTPEEFESAKRSALNAHYTDIPVIAAIWEGVRHLGITEDARILDPAAGIGHFKSAMPESLRSAEFVEIELDNLTARILRLLHPQSRIYAQGFQDVPLPKGFFDLAISNVPFGDYGIGKSFHKLPPFLKKAIHDFFFAYTVDLLRPGGVMAYITSRFTLDKATPTVRQWLARRLDLLAAVRLPCTAFKVNAGTEVVTDVLFLQKRAAPLSDVDPEPEWVLATHRVELPRPGPYPLKASINRYWASHPENILGKHAASGSMYRGYDYNVEPRDGQNLAEELRAALLRSLPAGAASPELWEAPLEVPDLSAPRGEVTITTAAARTEKDRKRLERLHAIYKLAKSILADEIAGRLAQAAETRKALNETYDAYVAAYGCINAPATARLLRDTVEGPFLLALERKETGAWIKADIFFMASVREAVKEIKDPSPSDALLLCLDTYGRVDMGYIAGTLGVTEEEAARRLDGKVFRLPGGGWEVADEYLSGNILEKLNAAKAAAEFDPRFQANVEALQAAMPEPVPADDIRAPLGAPWIPPHYIEEFLQSLFGGNRSWYRVSYAQRLSQWSVSVEKYWISDSLLKSRWGTPHLDAVQLVTMGLNKKTPIVYDNTGDQRVVDVAATIAAQAKLGEIQKAFEQWLWNDPDRAADLVSIYNTTYNVWRVPSYDGSHLSFPGLSRAIELRPWQKNAAWRILQERSTLLWHDVGAGKTLASIAAIMEAKRLGFARKAMVVVPNHVVSQWAKEVLTAYPAANILVVTKKQVSKANRRTFMSRIAMNEWDMVIVPFSSFGLLPVSNASMERFISAEIRALEALLYEMEQENRSRGGRDAATSRSIKAIEKAKQRFEAKLERLSDAKKDDQRVITWEELGIDMLVVDEAHAFKNLFFATKMNRVAGLPNSNSQRAFDMFIKTRILMQSGGKLVFLTATPVTNTLAELYNMQRYLQYDDLEALGLAHFDAWASQFALAESSLELAPEGTGFRMVERFRKFVNLPELLRMWFQVADRVRLEDTADAGALVKRPALRGPYKVLVEVPGMEEYMAGLAERAEKIRNGLVKPYEDNMLAVTGDGRKAAADLSMVIPPDEPDPPMPKIDALVDVVERIYRYAQPVQGAQLIFCDLGTPKKKK